MIGNLRLKIEFAVIPEMPIANRKLSGWYDEACEYDRLAT